MQVTLENASGLSRRMRITVPSEQVESKVEAKLRQTAGQVRIKGFRPGKVPLKEVRRRFGPGIRQEVSSELMQSSFAEAIREQKVSPAGSPEIEEVKLESGSDLEFTAVFDVFPDIVPGDFSLIRIEKPVAEVLPADIDKMIETLREQRLHYDDVARESQDKDQLTVDFEGFIDGVAFEGGKVEGASVVLGSGSMIEGFEAGLLGMIADGEKDLALKFPEAYQAKELAGKDAVFKVKVTAVAEPHKPVLDDAFFAEFGVKEGGMDAFRAEVEANMKRELEAAVDNRVRGQVMDGLLQANDVELPQSLVKQEINRLREDAVQRVGGATRIDPSLLPVEMFEPQAKRRVSLGLIVNAIVEKHNVQLDDERVRTRIEKLATSYEDPSEVVRHYYGNREYLGQMQNLVLEEQVVDTILAKARIDEVKMSYEEAIKPPAPAAAAAEGEKSE